MQPDNLNELIKDKLKSYVSDIFYNNLSEINIQNSNISKSLVPKTTNNDVDNFCVFNKAPESGLWYNWATDVGIKYCAISYSAGMSKRCKFVPNCAFLNMPF